MIFHKMNSLKNINEDSPVKIGQCYSFTSKFKPKINNNEKYVYTIMNLIPGNNAKLALNGYPSEENMSLFWMNTSFGWEVNLRYPEYWVFLGYACNKCNNLCYQQCETKK